MVIKNFEKLATSQLRRQALKIAEAGLEAINTPKAFEQGFAYDAGRDRLRILDKKYDLSKFNNVYCIAFGKAAFAGITAVSEVLGKRLTSGFAIDVAENHPDISKITFRTGTHPHPSSDNIKAAKELVEFVSRAKKDDLVLCLISGGGSALLCYPHSLDVASQAKILKSLMESGADIFEMNAVRKHLSLVKGGQLAKLIYPAKLISLIFSDVPGDDLSTIASGPTVKDETTVRGASAILDKHRILEKVGMPSVKFLETPKDNKFFENTQNILFVSAKTAITAMKNKAEDLGFSVKIFSNRGSVPRMSFRASVVPTADLPKGLTSESRNPLSVNDQKLRDPSTHPQMHSDSVGMTEGYFQGEADKLAKDIIGANDKDNECLIGAGESTVVVKGAGVGGRNQEMALSALSAISEDQVFITLASDGHDNSDSAGAIVDIQTVERAKNLGLDPHQYLENNDSFSFFEGIGDSIDTGFTGANVADLFVCIKN